MKWACWFLVAVAVAPLSPVHAQRRAPPQKQAPKPPGPVPRPPEAKPTPIKPKELPNEATGTSARSLFTLSDLDKNGTLEVKEAAAAGLGPRDCIAGDLDGNQKLSVDEFLVAYCGSLTRLERPVAKELRDEAAKIAARPVKPAAPAPAPRAAGAPANKVANAKAVLEGKIADALRKAVNEATPAAAGDGKRERRANGGEESSGEGLAEKAADAKGALNKRLRNAEVTPEQAAEQRQKLEQRIDNAEKSAEAKKQAAAPPAPAPAAPVAAAPTPSEAPQPAGDAATPKGDPTKALWDALEKRLADTGATPEQAEAAREKLRKRIANAEQAKDEGAAPNAAEANADKARKKLERRIENGKVTPEQAAEAQAKLEKRITNSEQPKPAESGAPAGASTDAAAKPVSAEQAEKARKALERRIENGKVSPDQADAARAELEQRIGNAQQTPPTKNATPSAPVPPAVPAAQPTTKPATPAPSEGSARKPAERKAANGAPVVRAVAPNAPVAHPLTRTDDDPAQRMRRALERQIEEANGGTPRPDDARDKPGKRANDAPTSPVARSGAVVNPPTPDPKARFEQRDRELREALEQHLKETKATPEQAARSRQILELQIRKSESEVAQAGAKKPGETAAKGPAQQRTGKGNRAAGQKAGAAKGGKKGGRKARGG